MKDKELAYKISKLECIIEYDCDNNLHEVIGVDRWLEYRPKVPKHIPKEQVARYILKQIKKDKNYRFLEKVYFGLRV